MYTATDQMDGPRQVFCEIYPKTKNPNHLILSEISELAFTKGSVSNQQKHQEKLADKQVLIPATFQISSGAEVLINQCSCIASVCHAACDQMTTRWEQQKQKGVGIRDVSEKQSPGAVALEL